MFRRFFPVLLVLMIGGCSGTPPLGGHSEITVVPAESLPAPLNIDPLAEAADHRIGINDELLVDVVGFEELTERKFTVDSGGRISVPLAGQVNALDRTTAEIETDLANRLRAAFVRDPQVAVNISAIRSRRVTVDGEVREPGLYPVVGKLTLMQAVAQAKGVAEFAKQDDVVVFRKVGDVDMVALYNLSAIRRGAYPDPRIYPNDIVVVGESKARRIFRDVLQSAPLLLSPLVAVLNNN